MIPIPTATCRLCGRTVTTIEAPLHVEDHAARGETPEWWRQLQEYLQPAD